MIWLRLYPRTEQTTRTPPARDIGPMVSPQMMAARTGLRIGSMPEVNAAVTGGTESRPRDRQMVAKK